MTDEQAIVRLHQKRQRGKDLKRIITALEDDLRTRCKIWTEMADCLTSSRHLMFFVGNGNSIRVYNPQRSITPTRILGLRPGPEEYFEKVKDFDKAALDGDQLMSGLKQLYEAKKELTEVVEYCQGAGDPLN